MTKVLSVITDLNIGGAGVVLLNFMKKTDRARFDHTVAVPEGSELAPRLRGLGIKVVEMPGIGERSLRLRTILAFRAVLADLRPDIVHTHASLSARIAATLRGGCAVIHTRHCAYPQGKVKTSFPVKQMLGFLNNRLSDAIIAISPAAAENLVSTGTDPKIITTMFNGTDPARLLGDEERSAVRASLGIDRDDFVCAIIARLVPEKGHDCVLDAAAMLSSLPIRFIIAGAGPLDAELRATAARRGLGNCVFTGFVEDVARIENITDLQLNASYGTETSSLSVLEGMSLGVPAVVSDFGGNPHIVTDGFDGLVFPRRDPSALASAIQRLYDERDTLSRMGANAKTTYGERFTAEEMAAGIERVYGKFASALCGAQVVRSQ